MSSEDASRVDRLFIAASAIVWSAITVFAVVSIVTSSTTGVVFAFVAIIAGALAWGKIVRRWLELRVSGAAISRGLRTRSGCFARPLRDLGRAPSI